MKQVSVNWKKWENMNRWQRIKCFFGYHQISPLDWICSMDAISMSTRCVHCNKYIKVV